MAQQLLTRADLESVYDLALEMGLSDPSRRSLLLAWMPPALVANLPKHATPASQLRADLTALNAIAPLDATTDSALATWLTNAERLVSYLPKAKRFAEIRARIGQAVVAFKAPLPEPAPPASSTPKPQPSEPQPATTDLIVRVQGNVRVLLWRGSELCRASAPDLDWQAPLFGPDGDQPLSAVLKGIDGTWDYAELMTLGTQLADLLFPGLGSAANDALADATRVVLDLDAHAARAPWEYLVMGGEFVLDRPLSIVRHIPHQRPRSLIARNWKPVALISANPSDGRFAAFKESDHRNAIRAALPSGAVLDMANADRRSLIDCVSGGTARTVHFLGHGQARKGIALVDHDSPEGVALISAAKIAKLLQFGGDLQLVVLGSCHSGAMAQSARGLSGMAWQIAKMVGVPVVAMQVAVPQVYSTNFAVELYHQLGSDAVNGNIEIAVKRARQLADSGEFEVFGTPVLYADVLTARATG